MPIAGHDKAAKTPGHWAISKAPSNLLCEPFLRVEQSLIYAEYTKSCEVYLHPGVFPLLDCRNWNLAVLILMCPISWR